MPPGICSFESLTAPFFSIFFIFSKQGEQTSNLSNLWTFVSLRQISHRDIPKTFLIESITFVKYYLTKNST